MADAKIFEFRYLTRDVVTRGTLEDVLTLPVPLGADIELIDNAMLRLLDRIASLAFDRSGLGDEDLIRSEVTRASVRLAELSGLHARRAKWRTEFTCEVWSNPVFFQLADYSRPAVLSGEDLGTICVPCGRYPSVLRACWAKVHHAITLHLPKELLRLLPRSSAVSHVTRVPVKPHGLSDNLAQLARE